MNRIISLLFFITINLIYSCKETPNKVLVIKEKKKSDIYQIKQ
jgi:hypothetical protein